MHMDKGRKTKGLTCRRVPTLWCVLPYTCVSSLLMFLVYTCLCFLSDFVCDLSFFYACVFSVNWSFLGICLSSVYLSAFSICPSLCCENALKCNTYTYTYMYTQINCHVMSVCSSGSIWGNGREKRDCTLRKSWRENTLKIYLCFAIATLSNRFVCYNVLQCVSVCRRVSQRVAVSWSASASLLNIHDYNIVQPVPHIVMSHVTHRYMTHCLCVWVTHHTHTALSDCNLHL